MFDFEIANLYYRKILYLFTILFLFDNSCYRDNPTYHFSQVHHKILYIKEPNPITLLFLVLDNYISFIEIRKLIKNLPSLNYQ